MVKIIRILNGDDDLCDVAERIDYNVWFEGRGFGYKTEREGITFTLQNLKDVFSDYVSIICADLHVCFEEHIGICVNGAVELADFKTSVEEINRYLSFRWTEKGLPMNSAGLADVDENEWKKRKSLYWDIVKKIFTVFPDVTHTFKYKAYYGTYLSDWAFWGFCYIYLNDHNKTGVVLAGGGCD